MNYAIDPVIGPEIMDLLGIAPYSLDNPRTYRKIQEVVEHFSARPDRREALMKLVTKNASMDKLEAAFAYVQFANNRTELLSQFDPNDFDASIVKELEHGHLTKDSIKRIRQDLETRKTQERKLGEPDQTEKYTNYESTLTQVEATNSALRNYE